MSQYKRALRTFDTASLTANFQNIGSVIPFPVSKISFVNTSTVAILITDGKDEEDIELAPGSTLSIGEGLYQEQNLSTKYIFVKNTQLQVKQVTAAGAGKLIINALG